MRIDNHPIQYTPTNLLYALINRVQGLGKKAITAELQRRNQYGIYVATNAEFLENARLKTEILELRAALQRIVATTDIAPNSRIDAHTMRDSIAYMALLDSAKRCGDIL